MKTLWIIACFFFLTNTTFAAVYRDVKSIKINENYNLGSLEKRCLIFAKKEALRFTNIYKVKTTAAACRAVTLTQTESSHYANFNIKFAYTENETAQAKKLKRHNLGHRKSSWDASTNNTYGAYKNLLSCNLERIKQIALFQKETGAKVFAANCSLATAPLFEEADGFVLSFTTFGSMNKKLYVKSLGPWSKMNPIEFRKLLAKAVSYAKKTIAKSSEVSHQVWYYALHPIYLNLEKLASHSKENAPTRCEQQLNEVKPIFPSNIFAQCISDKWSTRLFTISTLTKYFNLDTPYHMFPDEGYLSWEDCQSSKKEIAEYYHTLPLAVLCSESPIYTRKAWEINVLHDLPTP